MRATTVESPLLTILAGLVRLTPMDSFSDGS